MGKGFSSWDAADFEYLCAVCCFVLHHTPAQVGEEREVSLGSFPIHAGAQSDQSQFWISRDADLPALHIAKVALKPTKRCGNVAEI